MPSRKATTAKTKTKTTTKTKTATVTAKVSKTELEVYATKLGVSLVDAQGKKKTKAELERDIAKRAKSLSNPAALVAVIGTSGALALLGAGVVVAKGVNVKLLALVRQICQWLPNRTRVDLNPLAQMFVATYLRGTIGKQHIEDYEEYVYERNPLLRLERPVETDIAKRLDVVYVNLSYGGDRTLQESLKTVSLTNVEKTRMCLLFSSIALFREDSNTPFIKWLKTKL